MTKGKVCISLLVALLLVVASVMACAPAPAPPTPAPPTPAPPTPAPPPAPEKIELTLAHYLAPTYSFHIYSEKMAKAIEERTDGRVKITIYPAQSLFKAKELFDAVSTGGADMCLLTDAYILGKVPLQTITRLPFLYSGALDMRLALDEMTPILQKHEYDQANIKILGTTWDWWIGPFSNVKMPRLPSDVKGLKIRAAGWAESRLMELCGAGVVTMPSPEIYEAIMRGTIDGYSTATESIVPRGLHEVTKYSCINRAMTCVVLLTINKAKWEALPPDVREVLQDEAREWWDLAEHFVGMPVSALDGLETQKKAGMEVHWATPEEVAVWKAVAAPIYDEWLNTKLPAEKKAIGKQLLEIADKYYRYE